MAKQLVFEYKDKEYTFMELDRHEYEPWGYAVGWKTVENETFVETLMTWEEERNHYIETVLETWNEKQR